jgi:hypothetical protein
MKTHFAILIILVALGLTACNESSNNQRYIINHSQKTIILERGYDRNNIYYTDDIFPGDTFYLDAQYIDGRWDMKTPIEQSYYSYYGDSMYLSTNVPFKVTKNPYDFDQWKVFFESGTPLPNQCNYVSFLTISDSDITQ